MTHKTRLYPGMSCDALEFFLLGNTLKAMSNGRIMRFSELSPVHYQMLKDAVESELDVKKELFRIFPKSELKRLEMFAKCRFGGLDFQADILENKLQEGEYWDCPLRGQCKSEGILCRPLSYNGNQLSNVEIKLLKLLSTSKTNEAIADEINLPMGSLHQAKKNLYKKLGIQTKQELALIAFFLNLI